MKSCDMSNEEQERSDYIQAVLCYIYKKFQYALQTKADHRWIEIQPVQSGLGESRSIYGCSHSKGVYLMINSSGMGLLVNFREISACSQSIVALISLF